MLHFNQKSPAAFRTTLGDHGTSMGFRWLLVFFSMLSPNLGFISRGAILLLCFIAKPFILIIRHGSMNGINNQNPHQEQESVENNIQWVCEACYTAKDDIAN